jgi:hypothetical protein
MTLPLVALGITIHDVLDDDGHPRPARRQDKERWMQLCDLARAEKDPQKHAALIEEINRLLKERDPK